MSRQDVAYWLALKAVPRLSIDKKLTLVKQFGLLALFDAPPALSSLSLSAKQRAAIVQPNWQKIDAILQSCQLCDCQAIGFDHPQYPALLKEIYDPPLVLFIRGDATVLSAPQLAIVGSRSATLSGKAITQQFVQQLTRQGLTITSGLAIGIDGSAHRAAVNHNAATIAVVATGLDTVYPARHKPLMQDILSTGGVIVSEFPPKTPAKAGHFPRRNRIISGLSLGVLVVEAELKSGSLITARTALEQNREVFAVPGSIDNPYAKGCHWLIKQGAKLVDEVADIISELDFSSSDGLVIQLAHQQSRDAEQLVAPENGKKLENNTEQGLLIDPLLASVGSETTPVDQVVSRSKLPVEEVLSRLTMLELRGLVSAVPGGYQRLMKG